MGKKRKVFTKEFKEDAVNYRQDSGKTADEIAAALGIPAGKYLPPLEVTNTAERR